MEMTLDKRFCVRCDAPLYAGETHCGYCGGGPSSADFQAVTVLSISALTFLALFWLLFVA